MNSPQLLVLSPANPLRSYSGVKYLCDALHARGVTIDLWASIPGAMLPEAAGWSYPVHSFWSGILGQIPRIRYYSASVRAFWRAYRWPRFILTVDIGFIREVSLAKRLRPELTLLHYCPELFTATDKPHLRASLGRYARYADVPDVVIDVEPHRALYRQANYGLTKEVLVIPNTLPAAEMPAPAARGALAQLAGCQLPPDKPVLLYTGRGSADRDWNIILAALSQMQHKPFFLAFCYGPGDDIAALRRQGRDLLGADCFYVADAVPRQRLLACIHEADAGLVYYRPSHSLNHRYAAPTKLYEYIAAGLPVIASNNPGIVELVVNRGLGVCVSDESAEALAAAIGELMFDQSRLTETRDRCLDQFRKELCYEVVSKTVIDRLVTLLDAEG